MFSFINRVVSSGFIKNGAELEIESTYIETAIEIMTYNVEHYFNIKY